MSLSLSRTTQKHAFGSALWVCLSAFTAMLAGCHAKPQLSPQEAEGKHLYTARCAHCHEENDLALHQVPPNLHPVFRHTKLPSGLPATDAVVQREILEGRGQMPAFAGRFTPDEMAALLAYLHTGLR